jgi:TonB-dependent SusC/RagA subfamily outer membrane receptor
MKFILILSLLVAFSTLSDAQSKGKKLTISGTILDVDGTPVMHATILIDGSATEAKSDEDGNYVVKAKTSAQKIAVVSPAGFLEADIDSGGRIDFMYGRATIDPVETPDSDDDILLNTGYGAIKKKYAADAVGFLDVEHSNRRFTTMDQILAQTPGLIYVNGMFVIAGSRTFQGFVPPLYVVDDLPMDYLPSIVPTQVATVTVLKGGSAAIYGTRAFGGVVIITTKL